MRNLLIVLLLISLTSAPALAQTSLFATDDPDSPCRFSVELMRLYAQYAVLSRNSSAPSPVISMAVSDPYYNSTTIGMIPGNPGDLWGLHKIDAEYAWALFKGDGVTVAVIDTGVDIYHTDLNSNIVSGYNFIDDNQTVTDVTGHGTHIAGIIAAENNTEGIAGVAPHAKIMPLRVFDSDGYGSLQDVADAITWAVVHGADIINLSLDATGVMPLYLKQAIDYAFDAGCVLVAAAGNYAPYGADVESYVPARDSRILAVAGTTPSDLPFVYSNYGSEVDVAAPAAWILSLKAAGVDMGHPGDIININYFIASGTSMSAAYVSGLAALLYDKYEHLYGVGERFNDVIMNAIRFSADDLGPAGLDIDYGYGLINAYDALTMEFDNAFNILDYKDPATNNTRLTYWTDPYDQTTYSEVKTTSPRISGTKNIYSSSFYYKSSVLTEKFGSDYVTLDTNGYKIYGFDMDFWGNNVGGVLDQITFSTPLVVCPSNIIQEGRTYYGYQDFTFESVDWRFSTAMTINGLDDVTLDSNVVVHDALKVTTEVTLEDLDDHGFYSSSTRNAWYMKGLGEIKNVEVSDTGSAELYNLRTAVTYYDTGRKKAEFVGYKANPQYVYYEYKDEADTYGLGHGRLSKAQRADGSYDIFAEYYTGTNNVKYKDSYDSNGNFLMRYEYLQSGALKYSYRGKDAPLSAEERRYLYNAAYPYIKYYLDRALPAGTEIDAVRADGLTKSFQLFLGGSPGQVALDIINYGAVAYDQTILGMLQLYDNKTTILDTYVEHYRQYIIYADLGYSNDSLFYDGTTYTDLADNPLQFGPFKIARIADRHLAPPTNWYDEEWDWTVDTGAAACLIQYAAEAYDLFPGSSNHAEYKNFAIFLADYLLKLQDVDGGIRHGPKNEYCPPYNYSMGTVTTYANSNIITGSNETMWTSAMNGKQIRIGSTDYIFTCTGAHTGTLSFNASTIAPGQAYTIYQINNPVFYWDLKSTETNERCLLAFEALYDMTRDEEYRRAADGIRAWLKTMFIGGWNDAYEKTFSGSSTFVGNSWIPADLRYMPTDVAAFANLDMMFNDPSFGIYQADRNKAVDDMFIEIEAYNAYKTDGKPVLFKFTRNQPVSDGYTVEWSSQMACAYLEAAYDFMKYGDSDRASEYIGKYTALMDSLSGYFSHPTGPTADPLALIAPYASNLAGNPVAVDTGTGYTTFNCAGALASAYYAIALTEGLKPWKYEYEDGEIVKAILNNGETRYYDVEEKTTDPLMPAADLDNDGKKEIMGVFPNQGSYSGIYIYNDGIGWGTRTTDGIPTSLTAADIDNDGSKEVMGVFPDEGSYSGIYIYNDGIGWGTRTTDGIPTSLTAADLDNDGEKEIMGVFPNQGSYSGIYIYNDGIGWGTRTTDAIPTSLTAADLDSDGEKEIMGVFPNQGSYSGIYIYNDGIGWGTRTTDAIPTSLTAADTDSDGKKEIMGVFPNQGSYSGIYIYKDGIGWGTRTTDGIPTSLTAADIDNDGEKEIMGVFPNQGSYSGIYIYNDGAGWGTRTTDGIPTSLTAADIDNDGKKEIMGVFPNQGAYSGIYIYKDGIGWGTRTTDGIPTSLTAADIDNDGKKEIMGVFPNQGAYSGIYIYKDGAGWGTMTTDDIPTSLTAADLDNDGSNEIMGVFPDQGSYSGIYIYNDGIGWGTRTTDGIPQTQDIYLPRGDSEMAARMDLQSTLSQANQGTNYTQTGTLANPPKTENLLPKL